jgi:hypothetical protein
MSLSGTRLRRRLLTETAEGIGIPKGGSWDCTMAGAAPVLPVEYVVTASRIADRRMTLAGYRLAELLIRLTQN